MKACPICGTMSPNSAHFCVGCGYKFQEDANSTPSGGKRKLSSSVREPVTSKTSSANTTASRSRTTSAPAKPRTSSSDSMIGVYDVQTGGVIIKHTSAETFVISLKESKQHWALFSEILDPKLAGDARNVDIANYPALKSASDAGMGWTLPSVLMLKALAETTPEEWDAINDTIAKQGGDPLPPKDSYPFYWSSEECLDDPLSAKCVCMTTAKEWSHSKYSIMNVRLMQRKK